MVCRWRVTAILVTHLIFLGAAAYGFYDTWAAGGDVRIIKYFGINPMICLKYLLRAPFGGEGWIISINNMEDLVTHRSLLGWLGFNLWRSLSHYN
jgi:photosystem II CP43 chlorophyll apoprotein